MASSQYMVCFSCYSGMKKISFLPGPKLSGLGLPAPQLLPRLVGLLDDLAGHFRVQPLLVESESVQRLIVRCLVPPEPFPDAVLDGRGYIVDVVVFLGEFVVGRDDDDLCIILLMYTRTESSSGGINIEYMLRRGIIKTARRYIHIYHNGCE